MLLSVEYCPVCKRKTEMLVVPMKLPIMGEGKKHLGTVTSWVVCESCNIAVRSTECWDANIEAIATTASDLEVQK
jgi:C4-type Zn-finger protein